MKEAMDFAEKLINHFELFIRHIAGGLAGLAAFAYLSPSYWTALAREYDNWIYVAIATSALCGQLVYAVHMSVVGQAIWLPIVYFADQDVTSRKKGWHAAWKSLEERRWRLDTQRWVRRSRTNPALKQVQESLNTWANRLAYTYCSAWSLLIVATLHPLPWPDRKTHVFWLAGMLLLAAVISDVRLTRRELFIIEEFTNVKN